MRNGLSADGTRRSPYSETSFTFYRTDVFEAAGIEIPSEQMTYTEFAQLAAAVHDPDNGMYGTRQRGKAGWGEKMALWVHLQTPLAHVGSIGLEPTIGFSSGMPRLPIM